MATKYYQCKYAYFYKGRKGLIDELLGRVQRGYDRPTDRFHGDKVRLA